MEEKKYSVIDTLSGIPVATGMNITVATLLLEALMNKYYAEPMIAYTIERESEEKAKEIVF